MTRIFSLLTLLVIVTGCATASLDEPLEPLGDFSLGHNIVVAGKAQKGPVSRDATGDEWVSAMTDAISDRFGRYEGTKLYHLGISVEGFMLAPAGVPVVYSPKSALIINVTAWDDAAGRKLNDEPHQMTIFEDTKATTLLVGSGHSRTKQEQLDGLSFNAAKAIEHWVAYHHQENGWFTENPTYNPTEPKRDTGDQ